MAAQNHAFFTSSHIPHPDRAIGEARQKPLSGFRAGYRINVPARHCSLGNFHLPPEVPDIPGKAAAKNRRRSIVAELAAVVVMAIVDASEVAGRGIPECDSIGDAIRHGQPAIGRNTSPVQLFGLQPDSPMLDFPEEIHHSHDSIFARRIANQTAILRDRQNRAGTSSVGSNF